MAGYIHDPLQIINLIADNLRDRYKSGFPVLKEIIQNADDAGSANEIVQLEFGLSAGLSNAEHSLLKGPGLYFLNNGAFTDSDYKAIRSFGLNRKAIEQSTIGKFGLGMKSVFHFCESFFFLARNNAKKYAEILNPWSGGEDYPSFHDDWNRFSLSDAGMILEHVQPVLERMDLSRGSYFLLWLPLRQSIHLLANGRKVGSIISEFPGDNDKLLSFLFQKDIAQKVASLLPLLRRINSIRFWHVNDAELMVTPEFQLSLKEGASRIGLTDGSYRTRGIEGAVSYQRKGRDELPYSLIYSGQELLVDIPELSSLRKSPLWPKSYVRDEIGMSQEAPDKAHGHSAVVFSRANEKEIGKLNIRWAVFLPVEAAKEEVLCGGDSCYRITLHGYFFVDAGRVNIEGLQEGIEPIDASSEPQNEVELRRLWNIRLARRGTLPLILPALEAFISKARLSGDDVWHLGVGIRNTKLFRRHRESICANSSWVCCLTRNGKEWRILHRESTFLLLPTPPISVPERPWITFPMLKSLEDRGITLLLKDAPHLHAKDFQQWNETYLLEVLHLKEQEVFADQGCLEYLLHFLVDPACRPFLNIGSLQDRLREIANRAFISLGIGLRQNRTKVQEFISLIRPENRYAINQYAPRVIRELQNLKTKALVLQNEFDAPEAPGTAQLSLEDALLLLKKLHELITGYELSDDQELINHCRAIAREILQRQDEGERRTLLIRAKNLRILQGYDCMQEKIVALSPADLEDHHATNLLFLYSQGITPVQRHGLAPKLQMAIKETVILVNTWTAELVFGNNKGLFPCHADSVLDSLGTESQPMQKIENRRQLLPDVAGADLSFPRRVRGLRYLLHGLENHFSDDATLWVSGYDQSPVWGKLWHQLESHNEDGWNLLDRKLVEEIPPNKWAKLSIREIKPKGIIDELRDNGTEGITGEQFSQDERNAVLRELVSDEDIWKKLPFHETVNGPLVRITPGKSYLETEITLPDELYTYADIIRRSNDHTIKSQQNDWLTPLSKEEVVRLALSHDEPAKFWRLVMNNLDPEGNVIRSTLLRDTAWLLAADLMPVKPSDVIYLENMQDEVDRLLVNARGDYWSPGKLHTDLQNHPLFACLKSNCFATGQKGFENLALLLGETEEYHVGRVHCAQDLIDQIVRTCSQHSAILHLPGWNLLASAMEAYPTELSKEYLLPEILKPIPVERIIAVLKWLQSEHLKVDIGQRIEIIAAFNAYLAALVNEMCTAEILTGLFLLSREGTWRPANELCSEAEGVADSNLLDDEQKQLLQNIILFADHQKAAEEDKSVRKRDLQSEISASADMLKEFFIEWEGLVAPEIICAFLSLLGDDNRILELAEQYRGNHSVTWVRDNIPWQIHHRIDDYHRQEWMYGLDQHQAMAQHRFIVNCSDGEMVQTCSILGDQIQVPLKSQFTSLITGGLFYEYPDGQFINVRIGLRKPRIEDVSPSELSGFLRSSAEYLLKKAYNQTDCDLAKLWDELDRSEQFDIRIAQQLILNHIPFYLRQLGVHKHQRLQELLSLWNEARYKQEEYYESTEKRKYFENEERSLLNKIQALLKTDEEVQGVVLNAVRVKMRDFQYTTASIPFELFQNADDAVVELAAIKAYPNAPVEIYEDVIPDHIKRFLVIQKKDSLTIVHWGRPVNAVGSVGFPGRERGFHQDLEKMLVLSSSDKSEDGKVTGKFGLGFKSVLLASDRPKLMSGRLSAEIIAGLCPIPLHNSVRLRSTLNELSSVDRRWQGTLIELPLMGEISNEIMASFSQLAGIMTIFSKQIRRIDIQGDRNQVWNWRPERIPISDSACIEIGELPLPDDMYQKGLSLYFRLPGGGILVALGPEGFRVLPAKLPAVWVVAPTKESEGLGFAINCFFDLDAGRARLAGNSTVNKQKALDLGRSFGHALRKLYTLTQEQWGELKTKLRFEQYLSVYGFWSTFWKVMSEGVFFRGSDEVSSLVNNLLCGENGLGYLISHNAALPNGMWGEYQSLTKMDKIRVILKGCLGSERIFRGLIKWEFFRNLLGSPDAVISDPIYAIARKVVPAIGQTKTQWRSMYLADVLHEFANKEKKVTPGMAIILGGTLNPEELKQDDFEKEKDQIEKALNAISFNLHFAPQINEYNNY